MICGTIEQQVQTAQTGQGETPAPPPSTVDPTTTLPPPPRNLLPPNTTPKARVLTEGDLYVIKCVAFTLKSFNIKFMKIQNQAIKTVNHKKASAYLKSYHERERTENIATEVSKGLEEAKTFTKSDVTQMINTAAKDAVKDLERHKGPRNTSTKGKGKQQRTNDNKRHRRNTGTSSTTQQHAQNNRNKTNQRSNDKNNNNNADSRPVKGKGGQQRSALAAPPTKQQNANKTKTNKKNTNKTKKKVSFNVSRQHKGNKRSGNRGGQ